MNIAIIFAGGTGQRMNTHSLPKQFLQMHGKPLLIYTLECFQNHGEIDGIVLVCLQDWMGYAEKLLEKYQITKLLGIVPGGSTGQESIFRGLDYACKNFGGDSVVLIHDGVRPFISPETISECLVCVREHGNAVTIAPATETIFVRGGQGHVGHIFDRSQCLMARAPQCFRLKDIYEAHQKAQAEGKSDFIDSAMMMQHYGAKLYTVDGPMENIKITTPTDFYLFRALLDVKEDMQIIGL